jgi:class 3 adenylate cyclase/tetratricopeptide (TPR) repeat protein
VTGTVSVMAVLFTDLVASTELRISLGEEEAEALRRTYFALLRESIDAAGGREVKTLGDGMMAAFPNASAALAGAAALQQAMARHNRRAPGRELSVRVGLSAGEVTGEDDDYFGTPVIEAARLCAAAAGGQILTGELVALLARGTDGLRLDGVGLMPLKGLPEPLATFELHWEPLPAVEVPLPAHLEAYTRRFLVGRAEERAALAETLKAATAGERQLVLVAGEPGIGKTRLVAQAAADAHAEGATVLFGRCGEGLGVPYRPIVEALRQYVATCPTSALAAHVARHGGELGRLIPELAARVSDLPPPRAAEPETERYLLFEAVAGLLAGAAGDGPVLVVLDDLHWADRATVALLDHLVRWAPPMAAVLVGTFRDADLSRSHPLTVALAEWRRTGGVRRLALRGLGDEDVVDFVAHAAGQDLDEDGIALAHALRRESDGSPFFLGELLRHLIETERLYQEDGRWRYRGVPAVLGVPESVRDVIAQRVERLSPETGHILAVASVFGREFELSLLAGVLDEPDERVLEGLEEALSARLVNEVPGIPGRFGFVHALVRQTLYDDFSAPRRLSLHRKAAEALEAVHGDEADEAAVHVTELAHHWVAATPLAAVAASDRAKAVRYARAAGRRAAAALAYEQAAGYVEAALSIVCGGSETDDLVRCELLVELGGARWRAGDHDPARDAFGEAAALARRLQRPDLLAQAALGYDTPFGGAGSADHADPVLLGLLDEALASLGTGDGPLRVRLLSRLAIELYFTQAERREEAGREAVAMAQRLGDPTLQLVALSARHWSMLGPDGVEERHRGGDEIVRIAELTADREMTFRGHYIRLRTAWEVGDGDVARDAMAACTALADELRQPFFTWQANVVRAASLVVDGRLAEGDDLAEGALRMASRVVPALAKTSYGGHLVVHRFLAGRTDEIIPLANERVENLPNEPVWRPGLAYFLFEAGRESESRAAYERVIDGGLGMFPRNGNWLSSLHLTALTCGYLGDAARAPRLYDLLLPYQDRWPVSGTGARLNHVTVALAVLATTMGRYDEAATRFEAALELAAGFSMRGWRVVTVRDYVRMLLTRRSRGPSERARQLVDETLPFARKAGMPVLAGQLAELVP